MAQWIIVFIAIGGFIYNSIVTHVTMKNDIKHLKDEVDETKQLVRDIQKILMGDKD